MTEAVLSNADDSDVWFDGIEKAVVGRAGGAVMGDLEEFGLSYCLSQSRLNRQPDISRKYCPEAPMGKPQNNRVLVRNELARYPLVRWMQDFELDRVDHEDISGSRRPPG